MDEKPVILKDEMLSDRIVLQFMSETEPELLQEQQDAFLNDLASVLHINTNDLNLVSLKRNTPETQIPETRRP